MNDDRPLPIRVTCADCREVIKQPTIAVFIAFGQKHYRIEVEPWESVSV